MTNTLIALLFIGAWIVLTVTLLALVIRAFVRMNREPNLRMRPTPAEPATGGGTAAPHHGHGRTNATRHDALPHGETASAYDGAPMRPARTRVVAAVMAGVAVLLAGLFANTMLPELMFLPATLAPGLAAAATMGALALPMPSPPPPVARRADGPDANGDAGDDMRVASLRAREPWTYAKAQVLVQPVLAAVLLAAYLCLTMATASPDDQGRMRAITLDHGNGAVSTATPYPGAWYAVPLIAVTAVLLALTVAALRRIAHTPSATDPRLSIPRQERADQLWRVCLTRFVTFLAVGVMFAHASAVMFVAGSATWRVGTDGGILSAAFADDVYPTLGNLQMMAASMLAVVSLAYLAMAAAAAVKLWTRDESRDGSARPEPAQSESWSAS